MGNDLLDPETGEQHTHALPPYTERTVEPLKGSIRYEKVKKQEQKSKACFFKLWKIVGVCKRTHKQRIKL
jgi:hypothetical protein